MRIGCPRERKKDEYRVALTPPGVQALRRHGHEVIVEQGAGVGAGFADDAYAQAGAEMVEGPEPVYEVDLVCKVKEPIPEEYGMLRRQTALFAFLHLAAIPELARVLIARRVTSVAYEGILAADGSRPVLTPMSMAAGRLSIQVGATALQRDRGGKGILLAGLPGVSPGHVVIVGGGVVGRSALQVAVGMGAAATVLDIDPAILRDLDTRYDGRIRTVTASPENLFSAVADADLLIGAVLVPGAKAPHVITRAMIAAMKPGSVAVDVAVDQGGCFETTHPTTHSEPTYVEEGVVHYAVANIPSLTAWTSTLALTDVTLPILLKLARDPLEACRENEGLAQGLTTYNGGVVQPLVADSLGLPVGRRI